jgi:REP element-mobilizing transposase RayT
MNARQIIPGATYLVTRRCTHRQFLLVPRGKCRQIFHYCLAYAVERTGVEVHAVVVMSNHYHLVVTDPSGVLPVFVECLNKMVAKCMNAALGRWENFWASEQASYVRLLDDDAVIDKVAYTLCNPVAAALVKKGKNWPGIRFARPGAYPVHRPEGFFREEGCMPKSLVLTLVTPSLGELSRRDAQDRIDEAVVQLEEKVRGQVLAEGRTFLGARAVMRQDPFDSPATREPRRGLSPRVATRNKWLRIEALTRCAEFLRQYREALATWCAENRDAVFPVGTYLMRHRHRVRCAEA